MIGSLVLAIVMISNAQDMHLAEIIVLVGYMLLQAYIELFALFIILVVALSPLLCIGVFLWFCFCAKREDDRPMVIDIPPKSATVEEVVNSGGECSICLQEIKAEEKVYLLPCHTKHIFHCFCLDSWMRVNSTCPSCRTELPTRPS